jgi:hypothetical protein
VTTKTVGVHSDEARRSYRDQGHWPQYTLGERVRHWARNDPTRSPSSTGPTAAG